MNGMFGMMCFGEMNGMTGIMRFGKMKNVVGLCCQMMCCGDIKDVKDPCNGNWEPW